MRYCTVWRNIQTTMIRKLFKLIISCYVYTLCHVMSCHVILYYIILDQAKNAVVPVTPRKVRLTKIKYPGSHNPYHPLLVSYALQWLYWLSNYVKLLKLLIMENTLLAFFLTYPRLFIQLIMKSY